MEPISGLQSGQKPVGLEARSAAPRKPPLIYSGGDSNGSIRNVTWSSWGGEEARGRGRHPIFKPRGGCHRHVVNQLKAIRLGRCEGHQAYLRLLIRETAAWWTAWALALLIGYADHLRIVWLLFPGLGRRCAVGETTSNRKVAAACCGMSEYWWAPLKVWPSQVTGNGYPSRPQCIY